MSPTNLGQASITTTLSSLLPSTSLGPYCGLCPRSTCHGRRLTCRYDPGGFRERIRDLQRGAVCWKMRPSQCRRPSSDGVGTSSDWPGRGTFLAAVHQVHTSYSFHLRRSLAPTLHASFFSTSPLFSILCRSVSSLWLLDYSVAALHTPLSHVVSYPARPCSLTPCPACNGADLDVLQSSQLD